MQNDLIKIGYIVKAHGTKGELKIFIEKIYQNASKKLEAFFISSLPYFIENISIHDEQIIVRLEEVKSREAAQLLIGKEIFAQSKDISIAEKPNPYNALIGFSVVDATTKELIGKVNDILEMPAQHIAQIEYDGKEILLPLNKETVKRIDKKKKVVWVNVPEGLLDVYRE